ncbi:hypothetical protein K1719_002551 [Acacia pycnantha]|nr:hypothetical protein K1719_002551 [Acacia pycnantha]
MKNEKLKKIRRQCGFDQEVTVEPKGLAGGLAVWWKNSIDIDVLYKSKNIIHVVVETNSLSAPKLISFIYGPPKEGERRLTWDTLRKMALNVEVAWLVVGDFNDVLTQAEKEGGNPRSMRKIIKFQSLLYDCNLLDLEFKGSQFTWSNKRPGGIVRERLDRALGNVKFREEFVKALVFHIEPIGSDHHALIIDCCYQETKGIRLSNLRLSGLSMKTSCRGVISQLRHKLNDCYKGQMTEETLVEAEDLIRQIEETWRKEESYWWQRSRVSWLTCGDKNTKFFHNVVIQRRLRNKILRLKNDSGDGWRNVGIFIKPLVTFMGSYSELVGQETWTRRCPT